jgi:hypothetical protein
VQTSWNLLETELFFNGKAYEPGARSMDRWLTWFTVDHGQGVARALLEDSPDGAMWHQSLP